MKRSVLEGFLISGCALGAVGALYGMVEGWMYMPPSPLKGALLRGVTAFIPGGILGAIVAAVFHFHRQKGGES